MKPTRPLVLAGFPPSIADVCRSFARTDADCETVSFESAEEAADWLELHDPLAITVNMQAPGMEAACFRLRRDSRLANVPIIGVAEELNDLAFPEIFGWGGDDVIRACEPRELVPRLRALSMSSSLHPPPSRGTAVVADPDRRRRVLLARVLKNAGYDVHFALDSAEAVAASGGPDVKLVVAGAGGDDAEEIANAASRCREQGIAIPWVLTAEPKRMAAIRAAVAGLPKLAVTDSFAPPENVLFVANELSRAGATEGRSSARVLYGTVVAFRAAGRDADSFGFSYNISGGGLYIRTLAPLASGDEVWLEMLPPRTDRRVRLEGKVVWRRRFGPIESATVPPGFGVQITDGSAGDKARFQAGYEAFLADTLGATRS